MPDAGLLPFGEWAPDLTPLNTNVSAIVTNAVPRGDGWGPFPSFVPYTQALPAPCRGAFFARNQDGSITVFAGTSTDLYMLDNTLFIWVNISKGGVSYPPLLGTDNWQFAQFNTRVIAVQVNTVPQSFILNSSTAFADLAGAPPQAGRITIVNRFIVLCDILGTSTRIQWSGFDLPTFWTPGLNQSDFQDLPDGGTVHDIRGGDSYGIVFQDQSIRSMIYAPGSPVIFEFLRIATLDGISGQYSAVTAGDQIYFYSPQGFKVVKPGGYPTPIGKERVDRTFLTELDQTNPQLFIACTDPTSTRVYWAFKSRSGNASLADMMIGYDWGVSQGGRWFAITGQTIQSLLFLAKPGLTLDALDAIAPGIINITGAVNNGAGLIRLTISGLTAGIAPSNTNLNVSNHVEVYGVTGTIEANGNWRFNIIDANHIDLIGSNFVNPYASGGAIGGSLDQLSFSLDTISSAATAQLAGFNGSNQLGFFNGPNLEAIIEGPAQDLMDRVAILFLRPMTDAPGCFGNLGVLDTAMSTLTYTGEQQVNIEGLIPQRIETRYARPRLRVPAGTVWTYALGVHAPDAVMNQGDR